MKALRFVRIGQRVRVMPRRGATYDLSVLHPEARKSFPKGCRPLWPGEQVEDTDWWYVVLLGKWYLAKQLSELNRYPSYSHLVKFTARPVRRQG